MARMRRRIRIVHCPLCNGRHETNISYWLYKRHQLWNGFITYFWCDDRGQSVVKLYDENRKYVCWQQNTGDDIPDYEDIPF